MKPVLFRITNNLNIGGVQRRLCSILPLLQRDYECKVITYKEPGELAPTLERQGIEVFYIPLRGKLDFFGLRNMANLMHQKKAAIVHGHSQGGSIAAALAGAMVQVPVRIGQVHTRGNHWYAKSRWGKNRQIWQERFILSRFAHHVACVSEHTRQYYLEHMKFPETFVSVLYNGLDPKFFQNTETNPAHNVSPRQSLGIAPDTPVIGFVGRIVAGKGLEYLLDFAKRLYAAPACATAQLPVFVLVGDGNTEEMQRLHTQGAELLAQRRLILAGHQDDVLQFYRMFNALIHCSDPNIEGFPGAVLEAAASGLPILARKSPELYEIEQYYPRFYWLDDYATPENAIIASLQSSSVDITAFSNTFSLEAMYKRTRTLYTSLLNGQIE